ncbi:MAG: response regulator [Bacteroidetes bacterium]|nr:response regulator [Bacteroidota bacterium]
MTDYRALIIDDDIWMQRILSKTLESYGFKTLLSANGIEGIALAVEYVPNLIILDILMPELSGQLTLKIIKKIKATKNIPILMVSAMSNTENLGLAVKAGVSGFISKPFTRATVFEKLITIFGKDNLDKIAAGQLIELEANKPAPDKPKPAPEKPKFAPDKPKSATPMPHIEIKLDEETKEIFFSPSAPKPTVTKEQLMQSYQDDEKRSIDSIKKLLMKTKK